MSVNEARCWSTSSRVWTTWWQGARSCRYEPSGEDFSELLNYFCQGSFILRYNYLLPTPFYKYLIDILGIRKVDRLFHSYFDDSVPVARHSLFNRVNYISFLCTISFIYLLVPELLFYCWKMTITKMKSWWILTSL